MAAGALSAALWGVIKSLGCDHNRRLTKLRRVCGEASESSHELSNCSSVCGCNVAAACWGVPVTLGRYP
jgi:hypothetical protein